MAILSNAVTIADAGAFSVNLGSMTLIKTINATSFVDDIAFVHGSSDVVLNNTYPVYLFKFINIIANSNSSSFFNFKASIDSGSNYNVVITSSMLRAEHNEGDGGEELVSQGSGILAQSANPQAIGNDQGSDSDQSASGEMYLFNPGGTTYTKSFLTDSNSSHPSDKSTRGMVSGYINTTSAVNAIRFEIQQDQDNQLKGTIKLYGIKDS